jgi:hypothetical protein
MITMTPEQETPPTQNNPANLPNATSLADRTPDWLKAPRALFGLTLALGTLYVVLSYQPLWHTDLWGHLSYGRLIWETGSLPATEPLMPLSAGMPFVDTSWLSQLIGVGMLAQFGVPGLQFLYAASITACAGLLLWRFYRNTGAAVISLAGVCLFLWVERQQLLIIRPQLGGLFCFCVLLVLLTSRRWSRAYWVVVPLLFALWANLHGSFAVGLLALGAATVGRGCDLLRRTRRPVALLRDRRFLTALLLTQLAATAVLANPYGLQLYTEVFAFSGNPNLAALVEWEPLSLTMKQGQAAAVAALALIVLYRMSPRRVSAMEVLLLLGFGFAALWISRMLVWWAPVAAMFSVFHASAVWKRIRRRRGAAVISPVKNGTWSIASLGITWICFAYTPFGTAVLHGQPEDAKPSVSQATPVMAVAYLNEHRPVGQMFNTYEWGDYLLWGGPTGVKVFVASHAHLVPEEIWQDYLHVINLGASWDALLDRYSINTVLLDKRRQVPLIDRLRDHEEWQLDYEDHQATVFTRKQPL